MIPITARVMTSGVKYLAPLGNSSKQYRSMPNVPTLSSTPTSSTAAPGGAAAAASGSQVWNGHSGALIANAMKNPRNSHFCTAGPGGAPSTPSASHQEARITTGISTAVIAMSTSAMPSTPSA